MSDNYPYEPQYTPQHKTPKKNHFFLKLIAGAIIFGLLAGGVFSAVVKTTGVVADLGAKTTSVQQKDDNGPINKTAVSNAVTVTDVSDIVKNVMPAIVQVTNMSVIEYRGFFGQYYEQEGEEAGSGVIISQTDKDIFIATNNHVVTNSRSLTITFCNDEAYSAELQGTYPEADLAVVRVSLSDIDEETQKAIKVATLGDSDKLIVGESSVVIGNALGYGQSVTTGVISALDREVQISNADGSVYKHKLIQTDAAVNPGNSGGGILNMNGEVIGIVSAKYSDTSVEGMGYAIPITRAKVIIDELIQYGQVKTDPSDDEDEEEVIEGNGAYLGITGVDIDESLSAQYNMPQGIYVSSVSDGTGAQRAGLKKGDVITGFENARIKTMKELQKKLAKKQPGDTVKITVAREADRYAETTVSVTLSKRQEQ